MANTYTESSSWIPIEKHQMAEAQSIIDKIMKELQEDEEWGYLGVVCEVQDYGVWLHYGECIILEHLEQVARALIEELKIEGNFVFSWADTCSKHRIDEFGGGAMALRRGIETVWVNAGDEAAKQLGAAVEKDRKQQEMARALTRWKKEKEDGADAPRDK